MSEFPDYQRKKLMLDLQHPRRDFLGALCIADINRLLRYYHSMVIYFINEMNRRA